MRTNIYTHICDRLYVQGLLNKLIAQNYQNKISLLIKKKRTHQIKSFLMYIHWDDISLL